MTGEVIRFPLRPRVAFRYSGRLDPGDPRGNSCGIHVEKIYLDGVAGPVPEWRVHRVVSVPATREGCPDHHEIILVGRFPEREAAHSYAADMAEAFGLGVHDATKSL